MNNEPEFSPVIQIRKRKQKRRLVKLFLGALIGVAIYFAVNHLIQIKLNNLSKPVSPLGSFNINLPGNGQSQASKTLQEVVQSALAGTKGTYGIAIKNLKTKESYVVNENRVFDAGSLYKLWVMTTVFNQIETGAWSKDQVLTEEVTVLNNKFYIEEDQAEQTEGAVTFTVHDALEQMITISHNYAALLLTEKLKLSTVKAYLEKKGFKESMVGVDGSKPTVTPSDMALFFEKLYNGELANKENTDKMLDLLKSQRLNDKLPKYLPEGTVIIHKTGELGWFSHDAGIIYLPSGDYIITILSESDFPAGAEERIAQVSKAVYEYFAKGGENNE